MHRDNIKHNFKILSTSCAREIGQNCSVPNLNALFIGLHLNVGKFKSWNFGNPSHSPIGKYFPNSKYENVKNKQIQLFIFAPAGAKILDLFDSEHPYLESRKSLLREFTPKGDFILMATGVPAFL